MKDKLSKMISLFVTYLKKFDKWFESKYGWFLKNGMK